MLLYTSMREDLNLKYPLLVVRLQHTQQVETLALTKEETERLK